MVDITIGIAFIAGLVSFLSPCIFPLVPAFLTYLVGTNSSSKEYRLNIFINSLFFVLGFSIIFTALGLVIGTFLNQVSFFFKTWFSKIFGTIIIIFGLYLLGIINLPFLNKEHKLHIKPRHSYFGSFLFGIVFAFSWTPCVGVILGSIITLAAANPSSALYLLFAYSLGLGIPFLIAGLFSTEAYKIISKFNFKYFNLIVGLLLITLGILVFFNILPRLVTLDFAFDFVSKYS